MQFPFVTIVPKNTLLAIWKLDGLTFPVACLLFIKYNLFLTDYKVLSPD